MSNRTSSETMDSNTFTVKMTKVSFSYRRDQMLLNNINMSFPRSSIYGLLGPSGCGKTTLLKLILGLKRPNGGTIRVNGRKPLDAMNQIPGSGVGFQPQEIALYEEFTIRETLNYFAQIYGMKSDSKQKRIEFLIEFLGLPNPDTRISKLRSELLEHTNSPNLVIHFSGGQQRRVSLAVTIVHNPPFLILDEPTVGVDPLLREKIWNHLVELSNKEKTSILITTHYVEEARRAHVVALMRSGTILVEHTPQYLLKHFDTDSLEEVFLKICMVKVDDDSIHGQIKPPSKTVAEELSIAKHDSHPEQYVRSPSKTSSDLTLEPTFLKRFTALTVKNSLRIIRNLMMLAFQILSPTFSMTLFLLCVGQLPRHINIAIHNEDSSERTGSYFAINTTDQMCYNLSHYFIDSLDSKHINLITYQSSDSALDSVRSGHTFGALLIDRQFSSYICDRLSRKANLTASKIRYSADATDITVHNTIVMFLSEAHNQFIKQVTQFFITNVENITISGQYIKTESLEPVLEIAEPVYGSPDISFRDFMTPGMTIAVIFILAVGLTALSFVGEKKGGVMDRTVMAGVRIHEILMAQIFVQMFVLLVQISVLLVILFLVFDITNEGNFFYIILLNLLQGVLGMTFGLIISIIAPDEQSALMLAFGSFLPLMLLSSVFWPIEGMWYGVQVISPFMPQTMAVIALRNVMLKGWPLSKIWLGFASTIIWTAIFVTASIILSNI